jgi:DNA-binding MarR family transcriptional regulator
MSSTNGHGHQPKVKLSGHPIIDRIYALEQEAKANQGTLFGRGRYSHNIWYRALTNEKGRPNWIAVRVMEEVWYRHQGFTEPTETGLQLRKRFSENVYRFNRAAIAEEINVSKWSVSQAVTFLVKLGLLRREIVDVPVNGRKLRKVVYLTPNIDKVLEIVNKYLPKDDICEKANETESVSATHVDSHSTHVDSLSHPRGKHSQARGLPDHAVSVRPPDPTSEKTSTTTSALAQELSSSSSNFSPSAGSRKSASAATPPRLRQEEDEEGGQETGWSKEEEESLSIFRKAYEVVRKITRKPVLTKKEEEAYIQFVHDHGEEWAPLIIFSLWICAWELKGAEHENAGGEVYLYLGSQKAAKLEFFLQRADDKIITDVESYLEEEQDEGVTNFLRDDETFTLQSATKSLQRQENLEDEDWLKLHDALADIFGLEEKTPLKPLKGPNYNHMRVERPCPHCGGVVDRLVDKYWKPVKEAVCHAPGCERKVPGDGSDDPAERAKWIVKRGYRNDYGKMVYDQIVNIKIEDIKV